MARSKKHEYVSRISSSIVLFVVAACSNAVEPERATTAEVVSTPELSGVASDYQVFAAEGWQFDVTEDLTRTSPAAKSSDRYRRVRLTVPSTSGVGRRWIEYKSRAFFAEDGGYDYRSMRRSAGSFTKEGLWANTTYDVWSTTGYYGGGPETGDWQLVGVFDTPPCPDGTQPHDGIFRGERVNWENPWRCEPEVIENPGGTTPIPSDMLTEGDAQDWVIGLCRAYNASIADDDDQTPRQCTQNDGSIHLDGTHYGTASARTERVDGVVIRYADIFLFNPKFTSVLACPPNYGERIKTMSWYNNVSSNGHRSGCAYGE